MNITNEELDVIDLNKLSNSILESEFKQYFLDKSGKEHYRLLAYLSTLYSNKPILDIGTYKGCSSLALSYNSSNTIYSFDIGNYRAIKDVPNNISYIIGNILDNSYNDTILNSPLILLDTHHTGEFERLFFNHLLKLNWKGWLILDDIYLNDEMVDFWNSIDKNKRDISHIGHFSGTGVVILS